MSDEKRERPKTEGMGGKREGDINTHASTRVAGKTAAEIGKRIDEW